MRKLFCILILLPLSWQFVSAQEQEKNYEAIVLLDKKGAAHAGHAALLLGNEETGYLLYSKSAIDDKWVSKGESVSSINDLNNKLTRYTDAFKVEITEIEFKQMVKGADLSVKKEYSLLGWNVSNPYVNNDFVRALPLVPNNNKIFDLDKSANCMTVVTDAFQNAGRPIGNMEKLPNNAFQSLKNANESTTVDVSTIATKQSMEQSTEGGHKITTHINHRIIVDDSIPLGNYKQLYMSDELCIVLNVEDLSKINTDFWNNEFKQEAGTYKFVVVEVELKDRNSVIPNKTREQRGYKQ